MQVAIESCLVTGASRGIGLNITKALLDRGITVVACARDTSSLKSWKENDLDTLLRNKLIIAQLDSTSEDDARTVATQLTQLYNIHKLDIVIANAGDASIFSTVLTTSPEDMLKLYQINTLGPLRLFQATAPLLQNSDCPKFILISSILGSISLMDHDSSPGLAYGCSKSAANFLIKKMHCEHPNMTSIAIHPGWVKTSMGQKFADSVGVSEPPLEMKDSISGILTQIFDSTRETTSGCFVTYNGKKIPW